ncbi:MAG: serine protease, partial [Conexibacter sp.]|nr:serine protease [Conexibacter sp.]
RASLAGTLPSYTRTARALGAAPDATPVRALIALQHRDQAGLDAFIDAVSDPASPEYGHYLSPSEFEARFAPTAATVAGVEDFARANGLAVASVPRNRAYVEVTGTVADAERAFSTTISRFTLDGATVQAPARALSVPAALAGVVTDVSGLDTGDVAHGQASPPPAYVNAAPCSTSWASSFASGAPAAFGAQQPDVPCGYTPQQLQGAYGVKDAIAAGLDGTGQRVAIIDAYSSPNIVADATKYSSLHGLPAPKIELHDSFTQENAPEGPTIPTDIPIVGGINVQDPQGWAGEETLDVEAVHSMAPGATIVYQGADSALNMDLQTAQNAVVSGKLAQIITNSYGGTTDDADATSDGIWQQAAAEGIGVYFSSGDAGDETAGGANPADRATDAGGNSPYVTSVGGTTLAVDASDGYDFETYWGTFSSTLTGGAWSPTPPGTFNSGGGGGTSQAYAQPSYQAGGAVPDKFSHYWEGKTSDEGKVDGGAVPGRVTPDVAMLGDPNSGFQMGLSEDFKQASNPGSLPLPGDDKHYGEYRIGGTSLSSPLFAGMMALADQAAGAPHGFANPALYAARSGLAFRDITAPASPVAVVRTNYTNSIDDKGGTSTLLRTAGQTGTLTSQPGYDDSTGLGSPKGLAFLRSLAPGSTLVPADPAVASGSAGASGSASAAAGTAPATPAPVKAASSCTPPAKLRFVLHAAKGQRVVKVTVKATGAKALARKGRRLTAVTIARPHADRFTVTVVSTTNRGSVTRSVRSYTRAGCTKGKPKVTHTRLRSARR